MKGNFRSVCEMSPRVMSSLWRILSSSGSVPVRRVCAADASGSLVSRGGSAILSAVARWQHRTPAVRASSSSSSSSSSMGGGDSVGEPGESGDDAAIRNRKKEVRKRMGALVDALSEDEIVRQSAAITAKVLAHPLYQQAKSVSVYLSFNKEVRTDDLVKDILTSGRKCYIPRFEPGKRGMEMVELASLEDLESLPVNKWGIRQPPIGEKRCSVFDAGELDLVLVPGLAFTCRGRRLGRGMGYYDTFLGRCNTELRTTVAKLGLAFLEQILPEGELPVDVHDARMDAVLYPDA